MTKHKLHPGVRWLWRIGNYFAWGFVLLVLSFGFIGPFTYAVTRSFGVAFFVFVFLLLVVIFLTEIWITLAYNRWLYEFTPEGMKVERGVIWKRYSNIPYDRIQNVDIHRGIIARIFGFSTVDVQTAGYSAGYGRHGRARSEGHIPAVGMKDAEEIRDFLLKKISGKKSKGGM